MPFDEENHGGHGGGDDPRHEGIEELVDRLINMTRLVIKLEGKCLSCTIATLGIELLSALVKAHREHGGDEEGMDTYAMLAQDLAEACGMEVGRSDE